MAPDGSGKTCPLTFAPSNASRASRTSLRRFTPVTVMDSPGFRGTLAPGTSALVKPCLAASWIRSWPLGTGRISPDRPTSPKITRSRGNGLSERGNNGRQQCQIRRGLRHLDAADHIHEYILVAAMQPLRDDAAQPGAWPDDSGPCPPPPAGVAPLAVIHQRLDFNQQRPGASQTTITALPGASSLPRFRKIALGLRTSLSPCSSMAKTPSSFTAPKRF